MRVYALFFFPVNRQLGIKNLQIFHKIDRFRVQLFVLFMTNMLTDG
jgi:hypothetical protein